MGFLVQSDFKDAFNTFYTNNSIDFSQYDTIEMFEEEIENILNDKDIENIKTGSIRYLTSPSLPEFTLTILDTDGSQKGKILFKNTFMSNYFSCTDNSLLLKNVLDVFMYEYEEEKPSHQMLIGVGMEKKNKKTPIYSFEMSMDSEEFIIFTEEGVDSTETVDMKKMKCLYMLIQKMLYERPILFIETSKREIPIGTKIKKTKHQTLRKRVVKTIKILQLNKSEYTTYIGKNRTITCPSWGVIGHTRTLKSGRQIWIKPYRKGKERNNPNVYSSKEYKLVSTI